MVVDFAIERRCQPASDVEAALFARCEAAEAEIVSLKEWMTAHARLLSDGECGHLQVATDMVLRRLGAAEARVRELERERDNALSAVTLLRELPGPDHPADDLTVQFAVEIADLRAALAQRTAERDEWEQRWTRMYEQERGLRTEVAALRKANDYRIAGIREALRSLNVLGAAGADAVDNAVHALLSATDEADAALAATAPTREGE